MGAANLTVYSRGAVRCSLELTEFLVPDSLLACLRAPRALLSSHSQKEMNSNSWTFLQRLQELGVHLG